MKFEFEYDTPERKELFELYKIAVEEYRFEVRLNWERTRYFLALVTVLSGLAVGLLRIGPGPLERVFVAGLFIVAALVGIAGRRAIATGHEYYRRSVDHMKQAEAQLQLEIRKLRLATTHGMQDRTKSIVGSPGVGKTRRVTITAVYRLLLAAFAIGNLAAATSIIVLLVVARTIEEPKATAGTGVLLGERKATPERVPTVVRKPQDARPVPSSR